MRHARASLAALSLAVTAVGLQTAGASTPESSSIAVPKVGPATVTAAWTGTLSPGVTAFLGTDVSSGSCKSGAVQQGNDLHKINVTVPAGAYNVVKAKMSLIVDSSPSPLNGDFIELVDPAGNSAGTDHQKKEMEVDVTNPAPGTWTAMVCEFLPDQFPSHDYQAKIVIKTKCKAASPCPAPPKRKKK